MKEDAAEKKEEFKPNVFDVYDAATGKKIETNSSSDYSIVNDNLD